MLEQLLGGGQDLTCAWRIHAGLALACPVPAEAQVSKSPAESAVVARHTMTAVAAVFEQANAVFAGVSHPKAAAHRVHSASAGAHHHEHTVKRACERAACGGRALEPCARARKRWSFFYVGGRSMHAPCLCSSTTDP